MVHTFNHCTRGAAQQGLQSGISYSGIQTKSLTKRQRRQAGREGGTKGGMQDSLLECQSHQFLLIQNE